jgi:hypothetical protein
VDIVEQLEVHSTTVRFYLEALVADGRLEPFVEPDLCLAHATLGKEAS